MFSLQLSNFRSFLDQRFDFSRINILIGENSSGKSTILKFLLTLKQSLQVPENRDLNLNLRGEYTDLGSYKDIVYYNDESLPIIFSFDFSQGYYDYYLDVFEPDANEPSDEYSDPKLIVKSIGGPITATTTITYTLTKQLNQHSTIQTKISNSDVGEVQIIHSEIDQSEEKLYSRDKCTIVYTDYSQNVTIHLNEVDYEKEGFMSIIIGPSLHSVISESFEKDNPDYEELVAVLFFKIGFLLIAQNYLKRILHRIEYFNPLLTKPSRVYLSRDQRRSLVINDIEDVVDFLSRNTEESNMVLEDLNIILSAFGITEGLEIEMDKRMLVKELRVKIKDLVSNISDVGYGVALQIPMILKALLSERMSNRKGTVLLIEQPEVHLHPRLHATLIEIFLSLGSSSTYFIETHSEHIIRKLQVMVKKKSYKLKPNDISIYYLKRAAKANVVTKHVIDKNGYLTPNFPSGFFDASYNLSKELLG